ncbi:MAG: hypothetical protein ACRCVD_08200 [Halioglobus sp.]
MYLIFDYSCFESHLFQLRDARQLPLGDVPARFFEFDEFDHAARQQHDPVRYVQQPTHLDTEAAHRAHLLCEPALNVFFVDLHFL